MYIFHAELFLQPQLVTQTEHTLLYRMLDIQPFFGLSAYVTENPDNRYCNVDNLCVTSLTNMTTGVRLTD